MFDGKTKAIWTTQALFTHTLDRLRKVEEAGEGERRVVEGGAARLKRAVYVVFAIRGG